MMTEILVSGWGRWRDWWHGAHERTPDDVLVAWQTRADEIEASARHLLDLEDMERLSAGLPERPSDDDAAAV